MSRRTIAAAVAGVVATAGVAAGAAAGGAGGDAASDLAAAINERAGTSITADDVTGAMRDLMERRLDEAVAEGRLTEQQADRMRERAEDGLGMPWPDGRGPGHGEHAGARAGVLEAAAGALGLEQDALRERLRGGDTLAEVAAAEGVARAAVVAAVREALTEAGVEGDRAAGMAGRIVDGGPPGPGRHRGRMP
ncbi:hypothetical protein [Miltoncostaea marina]|uniref:hypothetical protein n=1 Tax=Miltoncostaea marina TaxID=2843215 RepID=UPI001C3CD923|nr:hypothetical protein [Miltoncostaea marina]